MHQNTVNFVADNTCSGGEKVDFSPLFLLLIKLCLSNKKILNLVLTTGESSDRISFAVEEMLVP